VQLEQQAQLLVLQGQLERKVLLDLQDLLAQLAQRAQSQVRLVRKVLLVQRVHQEASIFLVMS
jgi:ABC-type transporter Mla MlaB component